MKMTYAHPNMPLKVTSFQLAFAFWHIYYGVAPPPHIPPKENNLKQIS